MAGSFTEQAVGGGVAQPGMWTYGCGASGTSAKRAAPRGVAAGRSVRCYTDQAKRRSALPSCEMPRGLYGEGRQIRRGQECGSRRKSGWYCTVDFGSTAAPPPPAGPPWGMTCRRDSSSRRYLRAVPTSGQDYQPTEGQGASFARSLTRLCSRHGRSSCSGRGPAAYGARRTGRARRGDLPRHGPHRGAAFSTATGDVVRYATLGMSAHPMTDPTAAARRPGAGAARRTGPVRTGRARRHRQGAAPARRARRVPAGRGRGRGARRLAGRRRAAVAGRAVHARCWSPSRAVWSRTWSWTQPMEPVRFLPLLPMTPNEAAWKRVHGAAGAPGALADARHGPARSAAGPSR